VWGSLGRLWLNSAVNGAQLAHTLGNQLRITLIYLDQTLLYSRQHTSQTDLLK
jgi:hypothetical protein